MGEELGRRGEGMMIALKGRGSTAVGSHSITHIHLNSLKL